MQSKNIVFIYKCFNNYRLFFHECATATCPLYKYFILFNIKFKLLDFYGKCDSTF